METETAQVFPRLLHSHLAGSVLLDASGPKLSHVRHSIGVRIHHLYVMLGEPGQLQLGMTPNKAIGGFQGPVQELQEGRLTCSVGPHDGHARVAVHPEVQVLVEYSVRRVAKACLDDRDTRRWQSGSCWELQLQVGVVIVYRDRFFLQFRQHLHSTLSLLGHLLVPLPEALNELLQVSHLSLLLLGDCLLIGSLLCANSQEGLVAATVVP
mmetsp:Transcript_7490/g.12976  ORF Transcript_7490/g.12976 Transcript_7490/m.12976 type:complete len:210 (+) Transcript_7490:484-1113(+)